MDIATITTTIGTIISWLIGKKYLLPYIIQGWDWLTHKKKEAGIVSINAVNQLLEIKEKDVDLYESQIKFLNEQILSLQNHLKEKESELDKHYQYQDDMREELLQLARKVYMNERRIQILQDNVCYRFDCQMRIVKQQKPSQTN